MFKKLILLVVGLVSLAQAVAAPGYFRQPTLRNGTLVFVAEGDLWSVPLQGGPASRLTTHVNAESQPWLSPDGSQVAFTAQYEGVSDVYVMPVGGGLPKRLTFTGKSRAAGWVSNDEVLCAVSAYSLLPGEQLARVAASSGELRLFPLNDVTEGAVDAQGNLVFTRYPWSYGGGTRAYRGGTAQNLWVLPKTGPARPLFPDFDGTSNRPAVSEGRLYFASERDGLFNVWSSKLDGSDLRQLTHRKDFAVRALTADKGHVVYQAAGELWDLDVASGKERLVPIQLVSDFDQKRETLIDKPMTKLTGLKLSPDGSKVALTLRGQVVVAPVSGGRIAYVATDSGERFGQAEFTPDGKELIVAGDPSGEYEFWKLPANGLGSRTQLSKGSENLKMVQRLSPDGKWILYSQRNQQLRLLELASGKDRLITTGKFIDFDQTTLSWSPDSRWFAFPMVGGTTPYPSIYVGSVENEELHAVTSGRSPAYDPAWSTDGKWLYFLTERHLQSSVGAPWGFRAPQPYFDRTVELFQVALGKEERSPFEQEDEVAKEKAAEKSAKMEEPKTDAKKDDTKTAAGEGKDATPDAKTVKVTIQFDGILERQWQVPVAPGNYSGLVATASHLLYLDRAALSPDGGPSQAKVVALEIKNKDIEPTTVFDGADGFDVSADGKKVAALKAGDVFVFDTGAPAKLDKAKVDLSGLRLTYVPTKAWRQIFVDTWRLHRDYFYDKNMHGVDWKAELDKHLPRVERVTDRAELNDLILSMVSELSALHTFVHGGDSRKAEAVLDIGYLGAQLVRDAAAGGWRVERIFRADPDYPDALSPLAKPGMGVREGDVIVELNGKTLADAVHPANYLRGQANQFVRLKLKRAGEAEPFDVLVKAISEFQDADLRYTDWEVRNRETVAKRSKGKVGYVHLRAMGPEDIAQWTRDFYPEEFKQGLVLDLRHNNGGNIDSWVIQSLLRKAWMYFSQREGTGPSNQQEAFRGHVAVLVDAQTASDGEAMTNGMRQLKLGKIFGVRTWGGGIWLRSGNSAVDGGIATAAEFGSYGPNGEWYVEGTGITPDVIVDNPPDVAFRGEDPQMDAALAYLEEQIAKDPRPWPSPPPYPVVPWGKKP